MLNSKVMIRALASVAVLLVATAALLSTNAPSVVAQQTPPSAPALYNINVNAYAGITFGQMFGSPVFPSNSAPPGSTAQPPETSCCDEAAASITRHGMTVKTFVTTLKDNLTKYTPVSDTERALRTNILAALASLEPLVAPLGTGAVDLGIWQVRSLFEEDVLQKITGPTSDSSQQLKDKVTQLYQNFQQVNDAGLTLPWLLVAKQGKNQAFRTLVQDGRFVERVARCTYADFFEISMGHPLVDDEVLDLTQEAAKVGVFGEFYAYLSGTLAASETGEITAITVEITDKCCSKTTRTCVPLVGFNCITAANGYCTLASPFCP